MTMTNDLRARLEEDQRIIEASTPGPWMMSSERATHPRVWGDGDNEEPAAVTEPCSSYKNAAFRAGLSTIGIEVHP